MKVRKLLVTDIRCRTCGAAPGRSCSLTLAASPLGISMSVAYGGAHGERIAEHAELERAGWSWQEVNPADAGSDRDTRNRGPK